MIGHIDDIYLIPIIDQLANDWVINIQHKLLEIIIYPCPGRRRASLTPLNTMTHRLADSYRRSVFLYLNLHCSYLMDDYSIPIIIAWCNYIPISYYLW